MASCKLFNNKSANLNQSLCGNWFILPKIQNIVFKTALLISKIKHWFSNLLPKKEEKHYRISQILWILTISIALFVFSLFTYLWTVSTPSFEELENPKYDLASFIYDAKDLVIGKYFVENREQVAYDSINPFLIKSTIAVEDARFFDHNGIDYKALWRVGIKTIILGEKQSGGGSTITQQLAKLLYKRPEIQNLSSLKSKFTLIHIKLKEWVTAIKLEHNYTKEEILAIYLNKFEFVNGAHGIQSAARIYFNKDQKDLLIEECALLTGMLQNPSYYNPVRFSKRAKIRRNEVIQKVMAGQAPNIIDSIQDIAVDMSRFRTQQPTEGPAPYFRNEVTKIITEIFDENGIKKPDGSPYNVYLDGLKIYTSIDLEYQSIAEEAMSSHMTWLQDRFWKFWKTRDPLSYSADKETKLARTQNFMRHVKESDRYTDLWSKNMEILEDWPNDMEVNEKIIADLISYETVLPETLKEYAQLLKTNYWKDVKNSYSKHLAEFDSIFNKSIDMEVFDHKTKIKKVNMSPVDSVMYHLKHLQAGLLALDPKTGLVKAWVGGLDYRFFKYDHVTSVRQVGSTVKPFVYAAAMQYKDIKPCQYFTDMPYTIKPGEAKFELSEEWKPDNSTENFTYNPYNLYHGLLYSKNSITVRLMKELGDVEILRTLLDKIGIDKDKKLLNGQLAVPNAPAVCLGAMDVSLFDMVGAYTTFVNKGVYSKPVIIQRIEDRYGRIIYNGFSPKRVAMDPLTASAISDMLQNNCKRNFAFKFKSKAGGKTGTTNDFVDGWFLGFTPSLVVGVWTGGEERYIRFTNLDDGQGFVTARPLFEKYITALEKKSTQYDPKLSFPTPDAGMKAIINCSHYKVIYPKEERRLRQFADENPDKRDSIMKVLHVN